MYGTWGQPDFRYSTARFLKDQKIKEDTLQWGALITMRMNQALILIA